jgi:SAM-dependent methyltransferase
VLDLSEAALTKAQSRLGAQAVGVQWIAADVTRWEPERTYDLWHDRAAFHFLTAPEEQAAYAERIAQAVKPGGHAIIATFAADGPEKCSGLPVARHDIATIAGILGPGFAPIEMRRHRHATPSGGSQSFQFSLFARRAD